MTTKNSRSYSRFLDMLRILNIEFSKLSRDEKVLVLNSLVYENQKFARRVRFEVKIFHKNDIDLVCSQPDASINECEDDYPLSRNSKPTESLDRQVSSKKAQCFICRKMCNSYIECGHGHHSECMNQLVDSLSYEQISDITNCEVCTDYISKNLKPIHNSCCEVCNLPSDNLLPCGHRYHIPCLVNYILHTTNGKLDSTVACKQCGADISELTIQEHWPGFSGLVKTIKNRQCMICMRLNAILNTCKHAYHPLCIQKTVLSNLQSNLSPKLKCRGCNEFLSDSLLATCWEDPNEYFKIGYEPPEEKIQEEPVFQCRICLNSFFISSSITLTCDHRYCQPCITEYIEDLILSSKVSSQDMKCPECNQEITYEEIKGNTKPEVFENYERFSLRNVRSQNADEYFKECPFCRVHMFIAIDLEEITCVKCKKTYCPQCNQLHTGRKCKNLEEEQEYAMENDIGIVKCPECGEGLSKESGCNFVACRWPKCAGRTFVCLLCGKQLRRSQHYSHYAKEGPFSDTCNTLDGIPDDEDF